MFLEHKIAPIPPFQRLRLFQQPALLDRLRLLHLAVIFTRGGSIGSVTFKETRALLHSKILLHELINGIMRKTPHTPDNMRKTPHTLYF